MRVSRRLDTSCRMNAMSLFQLMRRWIANHPWRSLFLLLFILSMLNRHLAPEPQVPPPPAASLPVERLPPASTHLPQAALPPDPSPPPSPELSFSAKQISFANKTVASLLKQGILSIHFSPPLGTIVYLEPKFWSPLLYKEKAAFTEMLLCYFHRRNSTLPAKDQNATFAIYNITTRQRLAKSYIKSLPPNTSAGEIRILN